MKRLFSFAACTVLSLPACDGTPKTNPDPTPKTPAQSYGGALDLELRGTAQIEIQGTTPDETLVTLELANAAAPHLVNDGEKLDGPGRFEPFPEAGTEIYTAKLSLPPDTEGPCAKDQRSMALSLVHKTGADRFAGSLTVYCGTSYFGVPARVLRLSGTLDKKVYSKL